MIEESDDESKREQQEERCLKTATKRFEELSKIFGQEKVGLIHGKMKNNEKDKVMKEFKESDFGLVGSKSDKNSLQVLVATTVIEVGVDVGNATVMVIENAENFGLSQLHQLRGRVGRSDKKSYCILLYGKRFGKIARQRLSIMRESNDGFYIAEEDLKLRGSGEMLGVRQSGMAEFRIASLTSDIDLLRMASLRAKEVLEQDSTLTKETSAKYRALLQLFSYGDCLRLVESG